MARVRNPVGVLSPIGQALENLGQSFFAGPSPHEQRATASQVALNRARTAKAAREAEDLQSEAFNRGNVARLFRQTDPAQGMDPGDLAANAYLAGTDPSDIGDLFLFHQANRGAPTSDVVRAFSGSGRGLGLNQALTLEQQQAHRAQDIEADRAKALAKIEAGADADIRLRQTAPTFSEARGQTLADLRSGEALTPEQERETIGANPSPGTPRNYLTQEGSQGITLDGMTDAATGQPIPPGSTVFTGQVQPDEPGGLTTSTRSGVQQTALSLGQFQDTLGQLRSVAQDPSSFGLTGNVRRFGQGVLEQGRAFASMFGPEKQAEFERAAGDMAAAGIAPEFFSPDLTNLEKMATLAAYQAASALADQTGRGLSDRDFQAFRQVLGDPTALLSNQERFLNGLDQIEQMVAGRLSRTQAARQGDLGAAPAPQQPGAEQQVAPGQGGEVFEFDPATGEIRQVQ